MAKRSPLFAGWRAGLARCTGATAFVALVNILFLSIATPNLKKFDRETPGREEAVTGALFEGDCEQAKRLSLWLHLAVNILSSILLTSGNHTQQVLTAPTRGEVERAHLKQSWLDIGILSYRNLRGISKRRVLAWAILAITSVPIHLLYNSVISLETSANQYTVTTVGANETSTVPDNFERLENKDCISAYARQFVVERSDLFVVIPSDSNVSYSNTMSMYIDENPSGQFRWMCEGMPSDCDVTSLKARPDKWKTIDSDGISIMEVESLSAPVQYCLSKPVEQMCRLALSVPLMAIVVGCNLLKLLGLGLTWFFLEKQPLLTLGDAVASFLDCPDPTTLKSHVLSAGPGRTIKGSMEPKPWKSQRRLRAYFVSPYIYVFTMVSSVAVTLVTSYLLAQGIIQITERNSWAVPSFAELWDRGFGDIDVECLIYLPEDSAIRTSLLSNTPQLIVSLIYTTVNGMWTAMMVGNEWNGYGLRRKSLRVTDPVGRQRKTFWLSLPWRYGLPLVSTFTLLHWLISQSIFFVRVIILEGDNDVAGIITRPGFSVISIIFAIICGSTIILATVGLSLTTCRLAIPQVATCSAVLSAACHPPEGDENAALDEVQWGVLPDEMTEDGGVKKRCSLTSWRVDPPIEGKSY